MQQERKEASACPDAKMTAVFRHRYIVVTPNSLGPYTRSYTARNREGLNKLMLNLNAVLWKENEERPSNMGVSYKCRYCVRSLYIPASQMGKPIHCTCWRCQSVMYCSPMCRDHDQEEHKMSCFLHPGWECKEAEIQRATMAAEAGQGIKEARVSGEKSNPQLDASGNESTTEVLEPAALVVGQEQQAAAQGQLTEQQLNEQQDKLAAQGSEDGVVKDASDVSA